MPDCMRLLGYDFSDDVAALYCRRVEATVSGPNPEGASTTLEPGIRTLPEQASRATEAAHQQEVRRVARTHTSPTPAAAAASTTASSSPTTTRAKGVAMMTTCSRSTRAASPTTMRCWE